MADETILDFPPLVDTEDADVVYVVRGLSSGRDRHSTKAIFLTDERARLDALEAALNPIGFTYLQLPGTPTPSALGLKGTWANVSATYSGNFFRVEGGEATAFEAGTQADALQRTTGYASFSGGNAGEGILSDLSGVLSQGVGATDTTFGANATVLATDRLIIDTADSISPNAAKTDDVETRPTNETIRVWERTV